MNNQQRKSQVPIRLANLSNGKTFIKIVRNFEHQPLQCPVNVMQYASCCTKSCFNSNGFVDRSEPDRAEQDVFDRRLLFRREPAEHAPADERHLRHGTPSQGFQVACKTSANNLDLSFSYSFRKFLKKFGTARDFMQNRLW